MKKIIYLLNIENFAPELTKITYPFINCYAHRIGAEIVKITERKFPEYPVVYEKLQIYELAKENKSDWNIYIDSDTLIHPQTPDFTLYLNKDTVCYHKPDRSYDRFKTDEYFLRDGRFYSPGNWFMVASDWCVDLWKPIEDLTLNQIFANITPTPSELKAGISREHLIDDYAIARNMARFGFKYKAFLDIYKVAGIEGCIQHKYLEKIPEKVEYMNKCIKEWNVESYIEAWT
jgi:hypothetical protein